MKRHGNTPEYGVDSLLQEVEQNGITEKDCAQVQAESVHDLSILVAMVPVYVGVIHMQSEESNPSQLAGLIWPAILGHPMMNGC